MQLQVDDICTIIEKCATHGVSSIQLDANIKIEFGGSTSHYPKARDYNQPSTIEELSEDSEKVFAEVQKIHLAERISNLMIEDPARYEEMLANGELDELAETYQLNEDDDGNDSSEA